jgi:hypothetical protein
LADLGQYAAQQELRLHWDDESREKIFTAFFALPRASQ